MGVPGTRTRTRTHTGLPEWWVSPLTGAAARWRSLARRRESWGTFPGGFVWKRAGTGWADGVTEVHARTPGARGCPRVLCWLDFHEKAACLCVS